ncbi:hypothetical protein DWG95_16520 [Escherichia coli]|nr:hypothetical protein [Escherichia coli]
MSNWWLPSKKYSEIEISKNPLEISADFVLPDAMVDTVFIGRIKHIRPLIKLQSPASLSYIG